MNKVRVEVFYQDNALQSIRIDKCKMEGLTAIENKPIPEWFMPVSGRASWKGLREEVKLQTLNAGPDTQYSYYFYGPDMPKSVFAYCVQQYGLGEMVAETSKEDNAQVYLESAQRCEKVGDEEGAFQAYKAAAEKYDSAEAQLQLGLCYAEGKGSEKIWWKLLSGTARPQNKEMQMRKIVLVSAMIEVKAFQKMQKKLPNGMQSQRHKAIPRRNAI